MAKLNIIPIIEFFEKEVEVQEMAVLIDECISNYMDLQSLQENCMGKADQIKLCNLRLLRNAIFKSIGIHLFE